MSDEKLNVDEALALIRTKIDSLDSSLITMLNDRAKLAEEVARVKLAAANTKEEAEAVPFYRPEREAQVLRAGLR